MTTEDRIQELEWELYRAHSLIMNLLPDRAREILESYKEARLPASRMRWEYDIVDPIVELAIPIREASPYGTARGYCPLCKGGSSSSYEQGFSLPEGLKRHLSRRGNIQQCSVMQVALADAMRYWDTTRRQLSDDYHQDQDEREEARRAVETTFATGPESQPLLIDEDLYGDTRTETGLQWADQRLRDLGFERTDVGKVSAYTRQVGAVVVYADPRRARSIVFNVFPKPGDQTGKRPLGSFYMADTWKHDLETKLTELVNRVVEGEKG